MKTLIGMKRVFLILMMSAVVMIVQSCVVYNPYSQINQHQVPVSDIVQMSKDGLSSIDIISQIEQTRSVYGLNAGELAKLRDEGVSDSVINYMEKTHFAAVNQNRQMSNPYYGWDYGYGYYGGLGFGWPYYGWGWGPTIVLRSYRGFLGMGGFHSGFHGGIRGGRH